MGLFVTSESAAVRPGVYAVSRKSAAVIQAVGTGVACLIEQQSWGAGGSVMDFSDDADRILTIAPPGMNRTNSGYLAQIRKAWPELRCVRVIGPTAAKATATFASVTPTNILTFTLKYPGTEGNAVIGTVAAATDGDSNHVNVTVSVTGASGTFAETFTNINASGVGTEYLAADVLPNSRLVGTIVKLASGIPVVGSQTFASGTNGTIDATTYVGTAGSGDKGVSLLEGEDDVNHIFAGDPTNSLRAAVNAGLVAHADAMGNRVAYLNGNSAQTSAAARTDVANYRSINAVYVDPWCYENDDVTSARQLVPSASFAASVASQTSPSTHISWRDTEIKSMLQGIVDVEFTRGAQAGNNSKAGVTTLIKAKGGGFVFEKGVTTNAPVDPTTQFLTRTRMGQYIAQSIKDSLETQVAGPNVPLTQQIIVNAIDRFAAGLVNNKKLDPWHRPYILGYSIPNLDQANPQASLDNGDYTVPLDVKTDAGMQRIFLQFAYGESVQVTNT